MHSRIISLEKLDHLLLPDMSYNAYIFKKCATVFPPAKPHISCVLTLLKSSELLSQIQKEMGQKRYPDGQMYKICTTAKRSGTPLVHSFSTQSNSIL